LLYENGVAKVPGSTGGFQGFEGAAGEQPPG
jgi:hypothetical protein